MASVTALTLINCQILEKSWQYRLRDRTTYLDDGAAQALQGWLAVRGEHRGTIFHPLRKGGKIEMRPLSDQAVLDILQQRGKEASIADFSPHDFKGRQSPLDPAR